MGLSIFNHELLQYFRDNGELIGPHQHTFGGTAAEFGYRFVNVDHPFHLIYRLDLSDPAIGIKLPGLDYLPLVYGFHYAVHGVEFTYRVAEDGEIKIVKSTGDLAWNPNFPYEQHPTCFPRRGLSLKRKSYDPTVAEDALSLQGVFGLDRLSPDELSRAVKIGLSNRTFVSDPEYAYPEWTDEETLRCLGRAPFVQAPPDEECDNPDCTAEIIGYDEPITIELNDVAAELIGSSTMTIDGRDRRAPSLQVIAIHEHDDDVMWGTLDAQLIFQFCSYCGCIRTSHQCT